MEGPPRQAQELLYVSSRATLRQSRDTALCLLLLSAVILILHKNFFCCLFLSSPPCCWHLEYVCCSLSASICDRLAFEMVIYHFKITHRGGKFRNKISRVGRSLKLEGSQVVIFVFLDNGCGNDESLFFPLLSWSSRKDRPHIPPSCPPSICLLIASSQLHP